LNGVGGVGGSADVVYSLRAALMALIASDNPGCGTRVVAGTDVDSEPNGAASDLRDHDLDEAE
jgi:hypothetical protein